MDLRVNMLTTRSVYRANTPFRHSIERFAVVRAATRKDGILRWHSICFCRIRRIHGNIALGGLLGKRKESAEDQLM